ncbi:MAG: hypothetical protein HYU37_12175 [Acidobacteria bacterium]|nr:hypothetical protein [Acidobacteriota bacterium]
MRVCLVAVTAALVLVVSAGRADAWGYDVHRFLMDRTVDLLPPELGPLFDRYRDIVVERSIDPDTWRTAGFEEEDKHHFLDLDWEGYGPYPFTGLPRDFTAAVARFGRAQIEQNGTLPWRVEEYYGNLRRAFQAYQRPTALGRFNVLLFAAALAHYVADAMVPFHAVVNYDGQLTGQSGIHARFETGLFERYRAELRLTPQPLPPVANAREFVFDRLLEGTRLVPAVLQHDREAIASRDVYDEAYFAAFFAATRPILERRLSEAAATSAAMIAGAWDAAGRPAVPVDLPRPAPQRRRVR